MSLTLLYNFATEIVINGTNHQAEHANIANKFNAGITSADLSPTAGITASQMAASYQAMQITLGPVTGAMWGIPITPSSIVATCPLIGVTGGAYLPWTVTDIYSVCTDVGAKTQTFSILYLGDTGAGAFNTAAPSNTFGPYTISSTGAVNKVGIQALAAGLTTALTLTAGPQLFAIQLGTTVDATMLGNLKDTWTVSINLRRQITA